MLNSVDKCFGFVRNFGFKGPFMYDYAKNLYHVYVKETLVISVVYDGKFWVDLIRLKKEFNCLESREMKLHEIASRFLRYYDLSVLDPRQKIFSSVDFIDHDDKILWYYSSLLAKNPEILEGDFSKFRTESVFSRLFRRKKPNFAV